MYLATPQILDPEEWRKNNQFRFNQSDNSRAEWFRVQEQSKQLIKEKSKLTEATQEAVTEKITQKARETRELKKQIENAIENLNTAIKKLSLQNERLVKAANETQTAIIITNECIELRGQRVTTDLVEDSLQLDLLKQMEMLQTYLTYSQMLSSDAGNQIKRNHSTKVALEKDWSDKWESYNIDIVCGEMSNTSSDQIAFYGGPEHICSKWSTPEQWISFTRENIQAALRDVESSAVLYDKINSHLKTGSEDLRLQADKVEIEFSRRIREIIDALYRLKQHLKLIADNIGQAERTIGDLKKAILEKEPALKKVQTRLHLRNQRPNVELCRDPAHYGLMAESRQLTTTIRSLQEQLARAEASLSNMLETRRDIEKEVAIKENTLIIDQSRCVKVWMKFPRREKLLGY